jgi:hypothetical protein
MEALNQGLYLVACPENIERAFGELTAKPAMQAGLFFKSDHPS